MGMMSQLASRKNNQDGYVSGGASSYPTTGFPASAYRGNNRRVGGGSQGQPGTMSGLANVVQYNQQHVIIVVAVLVALGYFFWHLDNRKK